MALDPAIAFYAPILGALLLVGLAGVAIASARVRSKDPALARELWLRYAAWIGIAAVLLGALWLGRPWWIALVALLSVAAFREYARAVGLWMDRGFLGVVYAFILLIAITSWWPYPTASAGPGWYGLFIVMPVWGILFVFAVPIVRGHYEHMLQRMTLALVGLLYFGWMLAHVGYLVNLPGGIGLILFLASLVALNDIAAFVVGKLIGRHKLRERLSPGKTWEGAVGAMVVVAAAGWLLRALVPAFPPIHVVIVSVLVSLCATMGDLALSVIKRDLGIKDWGSAIPGHGGILDRVNSLIFAAPMFFHYTRYFFT